MRVSEILRARAEDLWVKDLNHPFVVELYSGTLPLEKFKYYLLQDYNYLVGMVKTLSILAAKAPNLDLARVALELAYGTVTGELENYKKLLSMVGLSLLDAERIEPNPTNVAYMNFLKATAYQEGFYEGLASVLPCMWTYMDIAGAHESKLERNTVEVYRNWASTYLSEPYRNLVSVLREALDSSGRSPESLWPFFKLALKYEILFWEASYNMETWPF